MLVMDIIYIMVVCHRTALIEASSRGCNSIVEFLLNNNCDLNKADVDGVTALQAASQAGHVETVESLLNSGASPHVKDTDGSTPLTVRVDIMKAEYSILRIELVAVFAK